MDRHDLKKKFLQNILELKSVRRIIKAHEVQLVNYHVHPVHPVHPVKKLAELLQSVLFSFT